MPAPRRTISWPTELPASAAWTIALRFSVASLLLLCLACWFQQAAKAQSTNRPAPASTLEELRARIAAHISQPRFAAAQWGIKIVSLDSSATVFETNSGKLLKPASNAKLFTGALALDRLGPDYRIKTSFYSTAKPDRSGTLRGDLIVYGRGDLSFAARFNDGDYAKSLEPVVAALAAAGVKRMKGDLIGDESFFHGPPFGSSWTWEDLQYYYGAEVSALTVDDNVVDLVFEPGRRAGDPCAIITKPPTSYLTFVNRTRTVETDGKRDIQLYRPLAESAVYVSGQLPLQGTNWTDAVAVHRPALWFVTLLKEKLAQRGITVSGKSRAVQRPERESKPVDFSQLVDITSVESRLLSELLAKMMKPSQNLYAQLLLLQVGAVAEERRQKTEGGSLKVRSQESGNRELTTEQLGLRELKGFLREVGIRHEEVLLDDGSGLSRRALVTPNAIVQLLTVMSQHRHAEAFRAALPVAGVDGTLRNRMRGTAAERNVTAKTGTIGYVFTLSGYVNTTGAETLAFALMLNNYETDSIPARDDLDAIAVMLAEFRGRSRGSSVTY